MAILLLAGDVQQNPGPYRLAIGDSPDAVDSRPTLIGRTTCGRCRQLPEDDVRGWSTLADLPRLGNGVADLTVTSSFASPRSALPVLDVTAAPVVVFPRAQCGENSCPQTPGSGESQTAYPALIKEYQSIHEPQ